MVRTIFSIPRTFSVFVNLTLLHLLLVVTLLVMYIRPDSPRLPEALREAKFCGIGRTSHMPAVDKMLPLSSDSVRVVDSMDVNLVRYQSWAEGLAGGMIVTMLALHWFKRKQKNTRHCS